MKNLQICGQYLSTGDQEPFFLLSDTAWELAHKMTREEIENYFEIRERQGFTSAQVVALAEHEGLTVPNAYGRLPLLIGKNGLPDPEKPDVSGEYSYWEHLDFVIDTAEKHGMYVTLLPTWGDKFNLKWGKGPVVFDRENARVYGKWIASRYSEKTNIIWMLGGDRPLETEEHRAVIDGTAAGIREADKTHLITFHPMGGGNSYKELGDADYIDLHSAQTGHDAGQCYKSDEIIKYMLSSGKPSYDSEPRYEDHPACFKPEFGYWNADDVRVNAYRDVLAGACGHTYGHHGIWSVTRKASDYYPVPYPEALTRPGAESIGAVKKLRLSRPYFSMRAANELVLSEYYGEGRVTAAKGDGYIFAYSPLGLPISLEVDFDDARAVKASWFDTKTGKETRFSVIPAHGKFTFAPEKQGHGNDALLILDAVGEKL